VTSGARSKSSVRQRSQTAELSIAEPDQFARIKAQGLGKPSEDCDARGDRAALDRAEISSTQPGAVRQLLLGQLPRMARTPEICGHGLFQAHGQHGNNSRNDRARNDRSYSCDSFAIDKPLPDGPKNMANAKQIIFTKLAALAIAIATAWWWRSEGFGWLAAICAGVGGYIFWKIAIAVAIGRCQGTLLRAEMDAIADVLANKRRRAEPADDSRK
jgi:hypothetical protein